MDWDKEITAYAQIKAKRNKKGRADFWWCVISPNNMRQGCITGPPQQRKTDAEYDADCLANILRLKLVWI